MSEQEHTQDFTAGSFWGSPDGLASLADAAARCSEDWQTVMERWIAQAKQTSASPGAAVETILNAFPGLGKLPGTGQQQPVLGLGPEHQRQAREFVQAYLVWQQAVPAWQAQVQRAATAVLLDFRDGCLALAADAGAPEITELAARCLETHHGALLDDEAYLKSLARLEQARLRLQEAARRLAQPLWRELGLATQEDVLGLRRRQREEMDAIRRELQILRAAVHSDAQYNDD